MPAKTDTSRQAKKAEPLTKNEKERMVAPTRVPIGQHRDILTVLNKDPNYFYRWVLDKGPEGSNILRYKMAGYKLSDPDEVLVGADKVDKSTNVGGVVRHVSKNGDILFLMQQPRELYEEDKRAHHRAVDEQERQITEPVDEETARAMDGQYNKTDVEYAPWR